MAQTCAIPDNDVPGLVVVAPVPKLIYSGEVTSVL